MKKDRNQKGANKATALGPIDAAAMQSALELVSRGRAAEAEAILSDIVRKNPANGAALFNLGKLHHKSSNLPEAEKALRKALFRLPGDAQALAALAFVRLDQGDAKEGFQLWEKAKAHGPSADSLATMGAILRERGDLDEAQACFKEALRVQPGCIAAWYGLSRTRKIAPEELQALGASAAAVPRLAPDDKIKLEFALGKAHLDQQDAESAFRHYAEGNRLKKSSRPVDMALYDKYADSLIRLFNEDTVKKFRGLGRVTSGRPIFIVGMMRSGSTLTDQILSSHPDVASIGEKEYFAQCVPVFPNTEVPGHFRAGAASITQALMDELSAETLDKIGGKYLRLAEKDVGPQARIVDKMLHNYFWVGLIRLALPNARIIHTTRDPMDIGLSLWTLLFSAHLPWAYGLEDIGKYMLSYRKIMRHWERLFPGEIFEANYERMIDNQEEETRRLLDFCGLPWDPRCLKFHETKRNVNTASATQVRQPLYKDSKKRWKKYEQYLQPLLRTLGSEA